MAPTIKKSGPKVGRRNLAICTFGMAVGFLIAQQFYRAACANTTTKSFETETTRPFASSFTDKITSNDISSSSTNQGVEKGSHVDSSSFLRGKDRVDVNSFSAESTSVFKAANGGPCDRGVECTMYSVDVVSEKSSSSLDIAPEVWAF